jgi:hypothetical protein
MKSWLVTEEKFVREPPYVGREEVWYPSPPPSRGWAAWLVVALLTASGVTVAAFFALSDRPARRAERQRPEVAVHAPPAGTLPDPDKEDFLTPTLARLAVHDHGVWGKVYVVRADHKVKNKGSVLLTLNADPWVTVGFDTERNFPADAPVTFRGRLVWAEYGPTKRPLLVFQDVEVLDPAGRTP